ncbi:hypothetical protein [Rhodococcoides yunnanense]|jgi:hypothetical protein|uniref:hypothetical protein n=1 Tax=Rhodococcoides yunnanense TaxID=278209 RepID=UPI0022B138F1|nr:hypothetical protein [Rhodococcus yunnanensis]MCZ4278456.1 hypothetical protein [Rhodococcus yunnanensis]
MSQIDQNVCSKNASIENRLSRYLEDRSHISGIDGHGKVQRATMAEHQPEGGQWGAPCAGGHEASTPWPCSTVQSFDSPMNYMD